MRFDIITIFPKIFDSYLRESIIKRARLSGRVQIRVHDLRAFTRDPHKKVDDRPYGGGPGMVLAVEPLARALQVMVTTPSARRRTKVLLFSAAGVQFTQATARAWVKRYDRIVMIAGHYEGVDERIKKVMRASGIALREVSIGSYVLTGGELPAMVVLDAISRYIPGVLGKEESLEERRHGVGVPVYTRPEVFVWKEKKYRVPKILLGGDHKKIDAWRIHAKKKTVRSFN